MVMVLELGCYGYGARVRARVLGLVGFRVRVLVFKKEYTSEFESERVLHGRHLYDSLFPQDQIELRLGFKFRVRV